MTPIRLGRRLLAACLTLLLLWHAAAMAAPGDVLFSDDFNRAALGPWTTTNASRSGILTGPQVSQSPSGGAYTRNGIVTVTSPTFFAAVPAARLDIWVRRGSDAFSEDTDNNEDFAVEYQRADGTWGLLRYYFGSGVNGQIYTDSFVLPADALHGALAIRARQTGGSGFDWDYWHFDDVRVEEIATAPPLAVGSCEDFENGLNNWTVSASTGLAGINNSTANSPANSLFLNGGVVEVTSLPVDTTNPLFGDVTVWIRRGSDAFSENPDAGEDLVIEYRDDVGSWIALETFTGSGGQGQIFSRTYTLPAAARHAGFQLRVRMLGGSGNTWDFWHIDDVCLPERIIPVLMVSKVALTLSDPVNGSTNPKAIPGATVEYTLGVSNQGPGAVDADSIVITDPLSPDVALYVDSSGGDPVQFVDGGVPSGLSYSYATDVSFSNQPGGGPPYNYNPVPDAQGFDPNVTGFRVNPSGLMNPAGGGGNPSFNIRFRVRVE